MKRWLLLPVLLLTGAAQAQNKPYNNMDAFEMNLAASIKNVLRLAQDAKKEGALFTRELVKVSNTGEPTYSAPFPMPGFTASFTKGRTDRKAGVTYWNWTTNFIEVPKGEKAGEIDRLAAKADSIITGFHSYLSATAPDKVLSVYVLKTVNTPYAETDYASLQISFAKPVYQTAQEAYDSLLNLYRPLLSDPGTAKAATGQFCYAIVQEGFEESKAVLAIRDLLPGIATQNINAAYAVCMGIPYFVKYDAIKDVLTSDEQERLKKMAKQSIDEWDREWKRKYGKADPVIIKQKQTQAVKIEKACAGYGAESNIDPEMLLKGVTVTGPVNNKSFIGRLEGIDCTKGIVFITQPGYINQPYSAATVQVSLSNYRYHWKKNAEQYHLCDRCGGEGGDWVTQTETKTKELPFGYFEGIQTTSTKTTTKQYMRYCSKCKGTGLALEKERASE